MNDLFRLALDASLRIGFVAICVGAMMAVARVRSGAVRHAAWTAVLCAMLLMPALRSLAPAIAIPAVTHVMYWPVDTPPPPRPVTESAPRRNLPREPPKPSPGTLSPSTVVLAVYFAGLLLLLSRMVAGWYSTRLLTRAAQPVDARAWESADIAAPLTVGVLKPRILLPGAWKEWPDVTLRAVLAHETAHLRRRDTLVALVAAVNRCVFWFHPLAWWLQRELAAAAEQACDEAAMRTVSERRKYAEVLLEMAEAVQRRGGRLMWNGIGMHGGGSLQKRIDRILSGEASRRTPRIQTMLIAFGCASAIFIGAGCRQATRITANSVAGNSRVGMFYSGILMGEPEVVYQISPRTPPDYSAQVPEIRRKLEHSADVTLLLDTSTTMVAWGRTRRKADFDPLAYGKSLVERALQLEPQSVWARELLNVAVDQQMLDYLPESVWEGPLESRHKAIEQLPSGARFRELAILSLAAGDVAFRADHYGSHDTDAAKAGWRQAATYAREALDLAPQARSDPDYGTAFFHANMTLGMGAIEEGDAKTASAYLLEAAQAPVTDALRYPIPNARPWLDNWHFPSILMAALLRAGQRDAVVEFLESYAHITVSSRQRCLDDAASIRQGNLPAWTTSPANL